MLAIRAITPVSLLAAVPTAASLERPRHPLLACIGPALDTAFGLEHPVLFPERIAALTEALTAALDARAQEPDEPFAYHLEAA